MDFTIIQSGLYSVSEEEYYATITWGKTNKLSNSAKMAKLSSLLQIEEYHLNAQIMKYWGLSNECYLPLRRLINIDDVE